VEAVLTLVRRHVYDLEGLAGAATALWLASRDLGELRPLRDILRCSKANRSAVK
jgi:hypothetical protein